jgi:membrane protein DedA with SNARE-associated domain
VADWITHTVDSMGYLGIAALMFLENIFPPIPSELIMPFAGFAAARGQLTYPGVVIAGTIGAVLGQLPLYFLGRIIGLDRTRRFVERRGKWLLIDPADLDRAAGWFHRRGGAAVFLCRLVPGIRSLISLPAGATRMPLPRFLGFSALGIGLWSGALAGAGLLLGRNYEAVERYLGPAAYIVLGALLLAAVVWAVRRRRARRSPAHSEGSSSPRRSSSDPSDK